MVAGIILVGSDDLITERREESEGRTNGEELHIMIYIMIRPRQPGAVWRRHTLKKYLTSSSHTDFMVAGIILVGNDDLNY
jgi:hypothetical protein